MDPKLQTSFIPKKSLSGSSIPSGISLVSLITSVLFFVMIATSAAVFLYSRSLDSQIQTSIKTLKREEDSFDPATIENLVRLNERIEATKQILHNHIAVTPLFSVLQKTILRSIRFSDMSFSFASPENISLTLNGQALSYASIAYQSDTITQNSKLIRNPVFSDLSLDPSGNINFKFSSTLNPLLTSFEGNINNPETNQDTLHVGDPELAPPDASN